MADRRIIVARYCEDTTWTQRPPAGWETEIVQKGLDLPNEGREASSYCWWIATHYDGIDPEGTYAFLQGSPFEPHGFRLWQLREVDGFEALGRDRITEQFLDGWIETRPLGREWHGAAETAWKLWVSQDQPPPIEHSFRIGAQFLVPGRVLLARSRDWWEAYGTWLRYGHRPWIAERIWQYIMAPSQFPEADCLYRRSTTRPSGG